MHRGAACVALVLSLLCLASRADAAPSDGAAAVHYVPPVDAPVVDPFRPPPEPWAAGNRGLEYGSEPGEPVRAAAAGEVVFAGQVGGTLHVVVLHADGLRTSYSFLADIAVRRGDRVEAGQVIGTAGGPVHFGARAGDAYLDPATLFGGTPVVHLVPEHARRPLPEAQERNALERLLRHVPRLVRAGGAAVAWVHRRSAAVDRLLAPPIGSVRNPVDAWGDAIDEARGWAHYAWRLGVVDAPSAVALRMARAAATWRAQRGHCTPLDAPVPHLTERHLLVEVAGLGSHTGGDSAHPERAGAVADLDTAALGYRPDDVVQFSYRGGTTDERGYTAADTQVDIRESGRRLEELLERVQAEHPGVPVDIVAHSQGGLVTRAALAGADVRFDPRLPRITSVVTLATPHEGTNMATLADMIGHTAIGQRVELAAGLLRPGGIDPRSPSMRQMAEHSAFIRDLERRPLPPGIRFTSIAASGDLAVPPPRAHLDGATNVVVPAPGIVTQHGNLPGSAAAGREVALALTGAPPTCQSLVTVLADTMRSSVVSAAEDGLGAGLTAAGHWIGPKGD